jgi:hypothetical protein
MWFKWFLVGAYSIDIVISILRIGDQREPLESGEVAAGALINLLVIAGLLHYWTCK